MADAKKMNIGGSDILFKDENARNRVTNLENKVHKCINGGYLNLTELGTSYTSELKNDIRTGAFKKAVVGGYLTINGHVYYFAHPDYWLNTGDTPCTKHHMVVVPAGSLGSNSVMNDTNTTEGGYVGSKMRGSGGGLAAARAIIQADFGTENILTHKEYLVNAVTNGKASAGAWYDSDIDLMNERMVYGNPVFEPGCDGTTIPALYTIDKSQIMLFALRPDLIATRADWWLRDAVSTNSFASAHWEGYASWHTASSAWDGVRPAFAIC